MRKGADRHRCWEFPHATQWRTLWRSRQITDRRAAWNWDFILGGALGMGSKRLGVNITALGSSWEAESNFGAKSEPQGLGASENREEGAVSR
jgi:hypothetical protein